MGVVKKEDNKIFIQIADKWREIGELEGEDTVVLKVYRDRSKHLMNVWKAYGFAKDVIDRDDWFDYVYLKEKVKDMQTDGSILIAAEYRTYLIPRTEIVLEGRLYETDGFERQYFVPLTVLERYRNGG